jgi:hypothetical protein
MTVILHDFEARTRLAVKSYWSTLASQASRQISGTERADHGNRSAVTGGKQMDGFCSVVRQVLHDNGMADAEIFQDFRLELPGYFRPTKKWDMLVLRQRILVAAIEFKSQRGPSFGNNLNNRAEEAVGVAHDILVAYREKAFGETAPRPWLGWLMLVEDCPESQRPVAVSEPHFRVFPEFRKSSYARRYELLLRKLRLEKLFDSTALLLACQDDAETGAYREPAPDLEMRQFLASLGGHVGALAAS